MTPFPMGLRLALGGDRTARTRLLLMSGGVAAGVALLLGVAGAAPAALDRSATASSRFVTYSPEQAGLTTGVRAETTVGFWRGEHLRVLDVETVGPPVPGPGGIPVLPGPGEVLVSPALAEALQGPYGEELTPRLHGGVTGTIGDAGLVGPDELIAIAGAPSGQLSGDLGVGFPAGRGADGNVVKGQTAEGVADELRVALLLAAVCLIVPLLILVTTATRLSAASRERRAAALRLVGVTARQVSGLGAVEGAVVGAIGAASGLVLFVALRGPVARVVPVPDGVFAADVVPPTWAVVLTVLGVPVLTAAAGLVAVRRAAASPLDVRRQATPPHPSLLRALPLATGLLMLTGALTFDDAVMNGRWYGTTLLIGGMLLCLVGTAFVGPALARAAGALLSRFGPGPASHLAGKRLLMDPAAAARTVTGMALVVVVVGFLLAFLPLLAASNPSGQGVLASALRPGTVVASFTGTPGAAAGALETIADVEGAEAPVAVRQVQLLREGAKAPADYAPEDMLDPATFPLNAAVVDCAQLSEVLRAPLDGCGGSRAYRVAGPYDSSAVLGDSAYEVLDRNGLRLPGVTVSLPDDLPVLRLPDGLVQGIDGFQLYADVLFTSLPGLAEQPDAVLVATDGRAATVEGVRAALGSVRTPFPPLTAEEATTLARSATDGYADVALTGVALVVLVGGLSLTVTTADSLRERRNAHAALVAMGTPVRVLRRSVLLQTATPLLLSVAVAVGVAAFASSRYLRLASDGDRPAPGLPWAGYGLIAACAVVASLLATAAALPFVRSAAHPDALRVE